MTKLQCTFLPENKTVELDEPTPLSDAAALADVLIDHPCGARATCGKCRVRYREGAAEATGPEARLISREDLELGWRLSCQCLVSLDTVVEIPHVSRSASAKGFGDTSLFAEGFEPHISSRTITLPEPDLHYQWSVEDSLATQWEGADPGAAIGSDRFTPQLSLEQLGLLQRFAGEGGALHAVFDGERLLHLSPPGTLNSFPVGMAIDIGSTSLAAGVLDLTTGDVIVSGSALNPQVRYGADVISRIAFAQENPEGNSLLHSVLIVELNKLCAGLLTTAGISAKTVWSVCVAGNPAMLHTFLGVDVVPLGQAPYVGAWSRGMLMNAKDVGLEFRDETTLRVMPMIRSNVGADTVAALVACGFDRAEELSMMIDLGTNCEVVVGNRRRIIATSTAAGPAFEGANIRQGMRAAPGAIDRVSVAPRGRLRIRVLGNVPAKGICGSALLDATSILLRSGIVDVTGRMHGRDELDAAHYPELAPRIITGEHGFPAVILATREEADRGVPVMLNAYDIRQLQLIKGSINAGAQLLLKQIGASMDDVSHVYIAGAFGSFLRKSSVLDVGLIPATDPERVEFIGNAAGVGARMALVDRNAWKRAEEIRERAEYLELGAHPEYMETFGMAMGFFDSPAIQETSG